MDFVTSKIRWVLKGQGGAAATFQTLLARLLVLALNIATGVITARSLGPDGRGEQAAIIMWVGLLSYSMTLGIPAALIYRFKNAADYAERGRIFGAVIFLGGILGCIATAVGVLGIPYWMTHYPQSTVHAAQWFMVSAPLSLLMLFFTCALESIDDFSIANANRYLQPMVTLGLLGILVGSGQLTPLSSAIAIILPTIPLFFITFFYLYKKLHPVWDDLFASSTSLLSYGIKAYGVDVINTLAGQIDQIFIVGMLPHRALGVYAIALAVSRMLFLVQTSTVVVLLPKITGRSLSDIVQTTGAVLRLGIAASLVLGSGMLIFAPSLLIVLYGQEFVSATGPLRILVVEAVLSNAVGIMSQAFMATGKPGMSTILQGLGLTSTIFFLLFLIPWLGVEGACWGLLLSTSVRVALMLSGFPLFLKVPPPSLIMTGADVKFLNQRLG
jgi:O-antigen/teichoic acid export membrane protein